jgi:hypothetical protein
MERFAQVLELAFHEKSRDRRLEQRGDRLGARVRAVGRTERVIHVEVAEACEGFREFGVVLFLARVKPSVLHDGDPAAGKPLGDGHRVRGGGIRDEAHRSAEQSLQLQGAGCQGVFGIRSALGSSQVG